MKLVIRIKTDDVYRDMADQLDLYDTNDFPKEHYLHNTKNKTKTETEVERHRAYIFC